MQLTFRHLIASDLFCHLIAQVIHSKNDQAAIPTRHYKYLVLTYETMVRVKDKLAARPGGFRVVVLDEAHYIKNPKSQRTVAALEILKAAQKVALLVRPVPGLPLVAVMLYFVAFGYRFKSQ